MNLPQDLLSQIEGDATDLYLGRSPQTIAVTQQRLMSYTNQPNSFELLQTVLSNSRNPYALVFASSSLISFVSDVWVSISFEQKNAFKNLLLSLLINHFPTFLISGFATETLANQTNFQENKAALIPPALTAVQSVSKLMAFTLKMSWVDDFENVSIDPLSQFNTTTPEVRLVGLEVMNETTMQFLSNCLKDCHNLFVNSLSLHVDNSIQIESEAVKNRMFTSTLNLGQKIWNYEFELEPLSNPDEFSSVNTPALVDLLFKAYHSPIAQNHHRTLIVQILVQLSRMRKEAWNTLDDTTLFLGVCIHHILALTQSQLGFEDHNTFHGLCRLILSLFHHTTRVVYSSPLLPLLFPPLANLTHIACTHWTWSSHSLHYLMSVWKRLAMFSPSDEENAKSQEIRKEEWRRARERWERRRVDGEGVVWVEAKPSPDPSTLPSSPDTIPPFLVSSHQPFSVNHAALLTSPSLPEGCASALNSFFISLIFDESEEQRVSAQAGFGWKMCVEQMGQIFLEAQEDKTRKRAQGEVMFDPDNVLDEDATVRLLGPLLLYPSNNLHTNIINASTSSLNAFVAAWQEVETRTISRAAPSFVYAQLSLGTIFQLTSGFISSINRTMTTESPLEFKVHLISVCMSAVQHEKERFLKEKERRAMGGQEDDDSGDDMESFLMRAIFAFFHDFKTFCISTGVRSDEQLFSRLGALHNLHTGTQALAFLISFSLTVLRTTNRSQTAIRALAFLDDVASGYISQTQLLQMEEMDDVLINHTVDTIPSLAEPSAIHTQLFQLLGRMIQNDAKSEMWDRFVLPFQQTLQNLQNTASQNSSNGVPIASSIPLGLLVSFFDSLAGLSRSILNADFNRRLFSLLTPNFSLFTALFACLKDDSDFAESFLKFIFELTDNKHMRLQLGVANSDAIHLFRTVADVAVLVQELVEAQDLAPSSVPTPTPVPFASVSTRHVPRSAIAEFSRVAEPLRLLLGSVNRIFKGQYVPFAVCELFGDPSFGRLETAVNQTLDLVGQGRVFFYPELALEVLTFINHLLSFSIRLPRTLLPATLVSFLNITLAALNSFNTTLSDVGCTILDTLFTHLFEFPSSPLALIVTAIEQDNPQLPCLLLSLLFRLVLSREKRVHDIAADALFVALLTHQQHYSSFIASFSSSVPPDQSDSFLHLMQHTLFASLPLATTLSSRRTFIANLDAVFTQFRRVFVNVAIPIRLPTLTLSSEKSWMS
ncbi:hypothetical protein BLNAU_14405 [Blattamonas nauphoetae]|uniref:Importin N-terminal domain-containing protein n=1 Tax=Blattamonas nauphoetae TaxID=2049346 RepID=A0ABQ9XGD5_9EUKA|nr:hypothetical protein BLNAU_14405 [Blattamonas nauphoetae]